MVIIDLTAAVVGKPGAFARDLLDPARSVRAGRAVPAAARRLPRADRRAHRYAVPVVTVAADSIPPEAA